MFEQWLKQFPVEEYEKDVRLFNQGDDLKYCYYMEKGICSQLIVYENGTEIATKYFFQQDLLNIWGLLKGNSYYNSTVLTKTNVRIVCIPKKAMIAKLNTDFEFYRWAVERMIQNNQYVFTQYQKKSKGSAGEILCYAILALSQDMKDFGLCLPKVFSYNELSSHLRIHRITVSHIFKVLQDEGIIEKCEKGWLIKDKPALEKYASGADALIYND